MKLDWSQWDTGGKAIFIAALLALLAMLMPWTDIGIATRSGFSQWVVISLVVYAYPILNLLHNKPLDRLMGLGCAAAAIVATLIFVKSQSVDFFGKTFNSTGSGAWAFILAAVILAYGVLNYQWQPSPPPDQ